MDDYLDVFADIMNKDRLTQVAIKEGRIVESLDELVCSKHPKSPFVAVTDINDSWLFTAGTRVLKTYQCEECHIDTSEPDRSSAYDCPQCGIVKGEILVIPYPGLRPSGRDFLHTHEDVTPVREGEHYVCQVCTTQLGSLYWKRS